MSTVNTRKRHIFKSITWRLIGTIDTVVLSWFITGDIDFGLKIGGVEVITKVLLYYFHERVWFNSKFFKFQKSNYRHLFKTISWRMVGTIDTVIIGWAITGNMNYGFSIGGLELVTKMVLYYAHERLWYRSKFGLE